jgi:hypothetical protein
LPASKSCQAKGEENVLRQPQLLLQINPPVKSYVRYKPAVTAAAKGNERKKFFLESEVADLTDEADWLNSNAGEERREREGDSFQAACHGEAKLPPSPLSSPFFTMDRRKAALVCRSTCF